MPAEGFGCGWGLTGGLSCAALALALHLCWWGLGGQGLDWAWPIRFAHLVSPR